PPTNNRTAPAPINHHTSRPVVGNVPPAVVRLAREPSSPPVSVVTRRPPVSVVAAVLPLLSVAGPLSGAPLSMVVPKPGPSIGSATLAAGSAVVPAGSAVLSVGSAVLSVGSAVASATVDPSAAPAVC